MHELGRLFALATILILTSTGWLVFGGVMLARTDSQNQALEGKVADLWGQELVQRAPTVVSLREQPKQVPLLDAHDRPVRDGRNEIVMTTIFERVEHQESLSATGIEVDLGLDQRRKGLMWFSLYDVGFRGSWSYVHQADDADEIRIDFPFPVVDGVFDDFRFEVNGEKVDAELAHGTVHTTVPVRPGDTVAFTVSYRSRGKDGFSYRPSIGVTDLTNFQLRMRTDFADIDFPAYTLSPSSKSRDGQGWELDWTFSSLVTGHGMGMVMPSRVQPGPLVATMSLSAPISLSLFMLWIYVLGLLKNIDIHPVNHVFVAAAFFSFHLLFGYTADHLPVEVAFALSSVVSVFLTVSYLRLVAGPRFALVQAGGAQLLYLVGFSLAHFFEGFTGLTVTLLGIGTLFALGQLTGRIQWSQVFGRPGARLIQPV